MNEYTNPGPVENTIYMPVRGEQGSINISQIGGDVNVTGLEDLKYFTNQLFGALRIPKQYLGMTDDETGFNGGTSLALVSSRYAKTIKRIQSTLCNMITDIINLFLLDKGLDNYVNKFQIRSKPLQHKKKLIDGIIHLLKFRLLTMLWLWLVTLKM